MRKSCLIVTESIANSAITEITKIPSSVAVVLRIELARILLNYPSTKWVGVFPFPLFTEARAAPEFTS
jgi:hypothetical protein